MGDLADMLSSVPDDDLPCLADLADTPPQPLPEKQESLAEKGVGRQVRLA